MLVDLRDGIVVAYYRRKQSTVDLALDLSWRKTKFGIVKFSAGEAVNTQRLWAEIRLAQPPLSVDFLCDQRPPLFVSTRWRLHRRVMIRSGTCPYITDALFA